MEYNLLNRQLTDLIHGVPHMIANLSNAVALLYESLEDINWAGFYFVENSVLVLGPFQGRPACIEIAIGKGVCGTSAERKETIVVGNVHEFPGHIACSSASNSEIVVPLIRDKKVIAVLDIDSTEFGAFDETDKAYLEQIVRLL